MACPRFDTAAAPTRAEWLDSLKVNLGRSVMLMQAVEAELEQNRGAIVNFGSISSRVAQKRRWLCPVSKATILKPTRNQAMDLVPRGIRVNVVSQGWT